MVVPHLAAAAARTFRRGGVRSSVPAAVGTAHSVCPALIVNEAPPAHKNKPLRTIQTRDDDQWHSRILPLRPIISWDCAGSKGPLVWILRIVLVTEPESQEQGLRPVVVSDPPQQGLGLGK